MLVRKAPIFIMLALAVGSTALVVNRMLEDDLDDTTVSTTSRMNYSVPFVNEPTGRVLAALPKSEQARAPSLGRVADLSHPWSSTTTEQTPSQVLVSVKDGRLSVEARQAPLDALLAEISDQSGIAVSYDGLAAQFISIAFQDLALDQGLRKILEGQDIFFLYGARDSGYAPRALWVYPPGKGREMAPTPPEVWASTGELEQELASNADASARMLAVEAVIERKGVQATDTVLYALNDADEQVRYGALSSALGIGIELTAGTLQNLMQYDPSPFVRGLALKAMSEIPGANKAHLRDVAQAALADPHPDVQAEAEDMLTALEQPDAAQDSPWASTAFPHALREKYQRD